MSCWNKQELENMLEDVVNELDLSESAIEKHGPLGTAPAGLVRLVLDEKDREIQALRHGFKVIKGGVIVKGDKITRPPDPSNDDDEYCSFCGDDTPVIVIAEMIDGFVANQVVLCEWCLAQLREEIKGE